MTGVEAVSNGTDAFREPRVANAHLTLAVIVVTLGILLASSIVAYLAMAYGIMAMDQTQPGYQSVLSQIVGAVAGRGVFYYVAIGSALCILCLSANTAFVGFPRSVPDRGAGRDFYRGRSRSSDGASPIRSAYSISRWRPDSFVGRLRRHYRPADPALRHRRVPDLHHVAVRHGGALAARTARLSQRPRTPADFG